MCINEIATICSVVRDDGWKKNGTNILRLRLTFRRQSRYIKTNILLRKNQLDRNGQIKDTAVLLKVTTLIKQLEERLSSLDAFALSNMSIEDVFFASLRMTKGDTARDAAILAESATIFFKRLITTLLYPPLIVEGVAGIMQYEVLPVILA